MSGSAIGTVRSVSPCKQVAFDFEDEADEEVSGGGGACSMCGPGDVPVSDEGRTEGARPKRRRAPTNLPNKRGWTTGLLIPHFGLGVRIV